MKTNKRIPLALFVAFSCGLFVRSQDSSTDRIVVPLSDPGKPLILKADLVNGGISVTGYDGKEVVVESKTRGRRIGHEHKAKEEAAGMKRLTQETSGLEVSEEHNVVRIDTESWNATTDLIIRVPVAASLKLECVNNGDIVVDNVHGEIEAENVNGSITLTRVAGSVMAETVNGKILATFSRVAPDKAMSFVTLNGDIDVTLPADVKANVRIKSEQQGDVYSDFDIQVKAESKKTVEDKRKEGGRYRVSIDNSIFGSINGGGPEFQFQTFNGDIMLRKAK